MSLTLLTNMLKNGHITQDIYDLYKVGLDMDGLSVKPEEKDKPEFVVINIKAEYEHDQKQFNKKLRKLIKDLDLHNEEYDDLSIKLYEDIIKKFLMYDVLNYYSKQGYLCEYMSLDYRSSGGLENKFYMQFKLTKHKTRQYHADGCFKHIIKYGNLDCKDINYTSDSWYNFKFDLM